MVGTQLPPGLRLAFVQLSCEDQANGKMKAIAVITRALLQELGLLCGLREGMSWQRHLLLFNQTSPLLSADVISNVTSGDLQGREVLQHSSSLYN